MARLGSLFEGESHFERSIQFLKLGACQGPNEACQLHLAETYQVYRIASTFHGSGLRRYRPRPGLRTRVRE